MLFLNPRCRSNIFMSGHISRWYLPTSRLLHPDVQLGKSSSNSLNKISVINNVSEPFSGFGRSTQQVWRYYEGSDNGNLLTRVWNRSTSRRFIVTSSSLSTMYNIGHILHWRYWSFLKKEWNVVIVKIFIKVLPSFGNNQWNFGHTLKILDVTY